MLFKNFFLSMLDDPAFQNTLQIIFCFYLGGFVAISFRHYDTKTQRD